MSDYTAFSVNDEVKYKPTRRGHAVHRANHDRLFAGSLLSIPYCPIKVDEDGWASCRMWELMNAFGHKTHMGVQVCFDTTILLKGAAPTGYTEDMALLDKALGAIRHIHESLEIWIQNEKRLALSDGMHADDNSAEQHEARVDTIRSYENLRTHTSAVLDLEAEQKAITDRGNNDES